MKKVLKFMYVFTIIGLQSLGNMSVVTAILEEHLIHRNHYVTEEDIMDSITLSRLGPGATTANMVAFLGNRIAGFWGGALATFCYTIAPLCVIIIISTFIDKLTDYAIIASALKGCLVYICVMFIKSTIDMGKSVLVTKLNIFVLIAGLVATVFLNISGVWIIISAIVLSALIVILKKKKLFISKKTNDIIKKNNQKGDKK